ncbi:uncharacterized protein V1510DRAFT_413569 [Dipodascopsis tothii]|uniref:uncharacterized protein n=1 Tax=Dipodascopsis tothii TaxID=44089 RepID=UPI0034CD16E5
MQTAEDHKQAGNVLFKQEDYAGAVQEYTKAIIRDSSNPAYFTNRALCRLRLGQHEQVLSDCDKAIELSAESMKAHYYKSQALLELGRPNEALSAGRTAYTLAIAQKSASASAISTTVLMAKKNRWEARERRRIEAEGELLVEARALLEAARDSKLAAARAQLGGYELEDEVDTIHHTYRAKIDALEGALGRVDEAFRVRTVPEYLIDPISFNVFYDPVISKSGQSYEKSVLLEHLKNHKFDPFTREYLRPEDLRPNLALRAAAEEFLEHNGWAVDA